MTSIAASGAQALNGAYQGIAPQANLVVVRAFDGDGARTLRRRDRRPRTGSSRTAPSYKIRVLNLSFGAAPQSYYWDDPLNQAVMAAWRAGIVVVASAGNDGPDPMTIDVPGNVPYVITVGALTDSNTPYNCADDKPRVVLFDGSDVRRLREARGRLAGRPHRRVDVEQQLSRVTRPGLDGSDRSSSSRCRARRRLRL